MSERLLWIDGSVVTSAYRKQLSEDYGVEIDVAPTADQALKALAAHPDYCVIVLNPYLAPGERYVPPRGGEDDPNQVGLDLVRRINECSPATPIIPIIMGGSAAAMDFDLHINKAGRSSESSVPCLNYLPSDFSKMLEHFLGKYQTQNCDRFLRKI